MRASFVSAGHEVGGGLVARATTAMRLGWGGDGTQGRPRASANPGLEDATPLALGEGRRDGFRTQARWCEGCGIFNPSRVVSLFDGYSLASLRDRERGHGDRLRRVQEWSWRRLQLDLDTDVDADPDADEVGRWESSGSRLRGRDPCRCRSRNRNRDRRRTGLDTDADSDPDADGGELEVFRFKFEAHCAGWGLKPES